MSIGGYKSDYIAIFVACKRCESNLFNEDWLKSQKDGVNIECLFEDLIEVWIGLSEKIVNDFIIVKVNKISIVFRMLSLSMINITMGSWFVQIASASLDANVKTWLTLCGRELNLLWTARLTIA